MDFLLLHLGDVLAREPQQAVAHVPHLRGAELVTQVPRVVIRRVAEVL